jgi:type IV fimbrial biogenesis protein FimT
LAGFTLVEMMVSLSIAVILLTTAAPSFVTLVQDNRMATQANRFVTALTQARSEAQKRNLPVVLCKSKDGETCTTEKDVTWQAGWLTFVDADRDAGLDEDELILGTSGTVNDHRFNASEDFYNYIAFLSDGRSIGSGDSAPPVEGEFRLCDTRGVNYARDIKVSPVGRISVEEPRDDESCL